jgi:hypothetical protein
LTWRKDSRPAYVEARRMAMHATRSATPSPERIDWGSWRRRTWRTRPIALLLGLVWALSGCVSLSLPSIAHVHLGHVLSGWSDTPQRQGLLRIAQQDARVAAEHAEYAVQGARDLGSVRLHLSHVLQVLDPALEAEGPGSGYGLVRAIGGVSEHLGYAGSVSDASAGLKTGLPALIDWLQPLRREALLLTALAREGRRVADPGQALAYAQEAQQRSKALAAQLAQLAQRLETLLAAENPPYQPVAERYLFGLIRLPSGEWGFAKRRQSAGAY